MRRFFLTLMLLLLSTALVFAQEATSSSERMDRQDKDDHDDDAPIQSGYAVITPVTSGGTAPSLVVFETFGLRGGSSGATQAGVLPSDLTTNSLLFVDSSGRLSKNLAVAIVNPNASDASVTLTLRNDKGTSLGTTMVTVPAHRQVSKFITEHFSSQPSVPSDVTGTVAITSAGSAVSVVGLRFRGSNFSTLPVTNLSGSAGPIPTFSPNPGCATVVGGTSTTGIGGSGAVLLPQFAAGGGWATEIALVNSNSTGGNLTVRVDLFKKDGNPLTTALNGQTGCSFTNLMVPAGGVLTLAPRDRNGDDDF